jgi:anti-sigma-K factor RskA
MKLDRPERIDALAAEYVAGTLRGGARRRFEALRASHPQVEAAVQRWEQRLLPLAEAVPPQEPPLRVWRGIEQRLWPQPGVGAPDRRLSFWRGASALLGAVVLSLAVLLARVPAPVPPVIVVLQGTGAAADFTGGFVAGIGGDGRSLVARPLQPVALPADRVLELWAVPPEGGGPPRSLGLLRGDGPTVLARERLPRELLKGGAAALAVSVEPPGGSPTGTPTGPVVYAGALRL